MKILLIDGNSLINRAFYGIKSPLTNQNGQPTGAVMGFFNILLRLQKDVTPDGLCVTFDLPGPTTRHTLYPAYKATRKGMPDELASQLPYTKRLLDALGIMRLERQGVEADDLLGTLSRLCAEQGAHAYIATGDKDSFQLVGPSVTVLHVVSRMGKTETTPYDEARIQAVYGLAPAALIDLKGLMGDTSDNIPGVPGVGEKTALALMHEFGSLDKVYTHIDASSIRDSVRKKLKEGRAMADISRTLGTIDRHVALDFTVDLTQPRPRQAEALSALLHELDLRRLADRLGADAMASAPPPIPAAFAWTQPEEITTTEQELALLAGLHGQPLIAVWREEEAFCVAWEGYTALVRLYSAVYDHLVRSVLASPVPKVTHELKELMRWGLERHWPCEGFVADTALFAYLLDPSQPHYALDTLSEHALGALPPGIGERAEAVLRLAAHDAPRMREAGLTPLFEQTELPLCAVLARMEHHGFKLDRTGLTAFGEELRDALQACERRVYELAGRTFNILSPKQLGEVLFSDLGLPVQKKTKTGYSTDGEVLQKLRSQHPVVEEILHYRSVSKLLATYVDGLLAAMDAEDHVHTRFQMTVTATGRLSSIEPNLQNIPVRTDQGERLRGFFIPSRPGWVLVDADYAQIELRILAHIAGDTAMQDAFARGEDIHTVTATHVFHVPPEGVTPLMRRHAKAVNFGIVYGISAFSLSDDMNVSMAEAKRYMERYMATYPDVARYRKEIVETARAQGYVSTLLGRRRYLPELASRNAHQRSFGERVALNMPIQGTAADIMKLAMIAVDNRLHAEGLQAQLILQVHDELIVECPQEEAARVAALVSREMEGVYALNPPLVADAKVGTNWLAAK